MWNYKERKRGENCHWKKTLCIYVSHGVCSSGYHIEITQQISENDKVELEDTLRNVTRIDKNFQKYIMVSEDQLHRVGCLLKFIKT